MLKLERIPDAFDDIAHQKLDEAVNNAVRNCGLSTPLRSITEHAILLAEIVIYSNDRLDIKYSYLHEAGILVEKSAELRSMIAAAWELKSYRDIRNLAILNIAALRHALSESFKEEYRGIAIEGFYEYLTQNETEFNLYESNHYAKFCSIVQSSGTGKSRLLTELYRKEVVVLYMNLREEADTRSFPARDKIPASILCTIPPTENVYWARCYIFFIALFATLDEQLSTVVTYATHSAKEALLHWVQQMCDVSPSPGTKVREDFFNKFWEKYTKIHSTWGTDQFVETRAMLDIKGTNLPDLLIGIHRKIGGKLDKILIDKSNKPKLVIAIDEAHTLASSLYQYRPADVLGRVICEYSTFSSYPIWVVFASTTFKATGLAPPNEKNNSSRRPHYGQKLPPPYTQLGWDQCAVKLGDINVENVSKIGYIASYGRPLWKSLVTVHKFPSRVLEAASSELCGSSSFDPTNTSHILAIFGQRFGLNVSMGHPASKAYLESGHLRVSLATTIDRTWQFTSYPSEPLLSCAASSTLHDNPDCLVIALETLLDALNKGIIDDSGKRSELANRLLWLLAKDLYVRTHYMGDATDMPSTWDEPVLDCEMIPVVNWFEFIFGERIWAKEGSREMFKDAYVNFSHWVCMDANIAGSGSRNELSLDRWMLRHWQRTSGVQCHHQQPLIEKAVPVYFKGGSPGASAESRMSQIFITDKARESTGDITRSNIYLSREESKDAMDTLPYIVIVTDPTQLPSFSVTFPERDVADRCLRIYSDGMDTETFPFLSKFPRLLGVFQKLVRVKQKPYMQYLDALMKFGSTATSDHMEWEHGGTLPNILG